MGEEKQVNNNNNNNNGYIKKKQKKQEGGGKTQMANKEEKEGNIKVVLKVDMHCEGCAMKIRRTARAFEGVEKVVMDGGSGRVTVEGRFDPVKLCERVEKRAHRKVVVVVSPIAEVTNRKKKKKKQEEVGHEGVENKTEEEEEEEEEKINGEKKQPKDSTLAVVLKIIRLRCDCAGCIQKVQKTILRLEGVARVFVDVQKATITVKGTMNVKSLTSYIQEKLKRAIDVILSSTNKDDISTVVSKPKVGGNDRENHEKKKKKKKKSSKTTNKSNTSNGDSNPLGKGEEKREDQMSKIEQCEGPYIYGYQYNMGHAPQIFSDENPNACVVM